MLALIRGPRRVGHEAVVFTGDDLGRRNFGEVLSPKFRDLVPRDRLKKAPVADYALSYGEQELSERPYRP